MTLGVHILDVPYPLDVEYTYYVPDTLEPSFRVGEFVLVPFGGANKKLCALVTSIGDAGTLSAEERAKLKPVLALVNEPLALDDEMLALVAFLRDRTLCSYGDAVRRLIPADAFARASEVYSAAEPPDEMPALNAKASAIYSYLREHSPASAEKMEAEFGADVRKVLRTFLSEGLAVADTRIREATGATVEIATAIPDADLSTLSRPRTPEAYRRLYETLLDRGATETKTLTEMGFKPAQIKAVQKRGLITLEKIETLRDSYQDFAGDPKPLNLTDEQQAARDTLAALMDEGAPRAALLYGVTGSGKTSVILSLCEKTVAEGKTAIILVPEIALTRQSVAIFISRFPGRTAVIHSGLSDGERFDAYKRIRRGEVSVVLGTRSAIFAPLPNIGLIVIDEEQEATYKSDMSPKYHARDVAKHRAAAHRALLLLASATPSIESFYEAERGRYALVKLTHRYAGTELPAVTIADMRQTNPTANAMLGPVLCEALCETHEAGNQSMLFLNRRGYHRQQTCRACGETMLCPNCSVALTHHKTRLGSRLVCHYCGYSIPAPRFCPHCGSEHLDFSGYGTQLVEEELATLLPDAKVARMDADTTQERFSHDAIVEAFAAGKQDLLVGTQMIAKGHNFPKLKLVGVVAADNSLFLDDFRANERTFSLITQVIGRAGRAGGGGSAVIQTYNPDNETIRRAAAQDYEAFYRNEIAVRRALTFPPFCDIAVFSFASDEESALRTFAAEFADGLKAAADRAKDVPLVVYGPFEAPVFKIKNKFRMRLVLKFKMSRASRALFSELLVTYGKKAHKVAVSVDINPINF